MTAVGTSSGGSSSIALDTNGKVHVSQGSNPLQYATNVSGSFVETVVDSVTTFYAWIAVDSSGKPRVTYRDHVKRVLKYAIGN